MSTGLTFHCVGHKPKKKQGNGGKEGGSIGGKSYFVSTRLLFRNAPDPIQDVMIRTPSPFP